jgi:hypothetical protein
MEVGIPRIDLAGETIGEVLSGPRSTSFTAMGLRYLAREAPSHGCVLDGNSWVLQRVTP